MSHWWWQTWYWAPVALVFNILRPLVVPDVDRNEDFNCMHCNRPVLRRYLYCSPRCETAAEQYTGEQ